MRLITFVILILSLLVLAGCSSITPSGDIVQEVSTNDQMECPKGFENDPAPGACGLYTDTNDNNICDYSE